METLRLIQEIAVTALLIGLVIWLPVLVWIVVSMGRAERRHLTEERLRRFARLNASMRDRDASFAALETRLDGGEAWQKAETDCGR